MGFFGSFFYTKPQESLDKGNKLMASGRYYDARCAFEEGLANSKKKSEYSKLTTVFEELIASANNYLAILNMDEANHAIAESNVGKAREHIELAKTLTSDHTVREKADKLLTSLDKNINNTKGLEPNSSCSSCSSCSPDNKESQVSSISDETDLDPHTHYELLIHQLPEEMFQRYSSLGEDFAYMFIAASRDEHLHALELLESWHTCSNDNEDIYWHEKGKILHRLNNVSEAEKCFHTAIAVNPDNHLPYLGLALLLLEENNFDKAMVLLEQMIEANIYTGQAIMMRGEVFQITGNFDQALDIFASLLKTPLSKAAAEKIYEILITQNRHQEAEVVRKQYLASCCH